MKQPSTFSDKPVMFVIRDRKNFEWHLFLYNMKNLNSRRYLGKTGYLVSE